MRFKDYLEENLMPDEPKGSSKRKRFAKSIRSRRKKLRGWAQHPNADQDIKDIAGGINKRERRLFMRRYDLAQKYIARKEKAEAEGGFVDPFESEPYKTLDPSWQNRELERRLQRKGIIPRRKLERGPQNFGKSVSPEEIDRIYKDRADIAKEHKPKRFKKGAVQKVGKKDVAALVNSSRLKPATFASLLAVEMGRHKVKKVPADARDPISVMQHFAANGYLDQAMEKAREIAARFPGKPPEPKALPVYRAPGRPKGATMKGTPQQLDLIKKLKRMSKDSNMVNAKKAVFAIQAYIHRDHPNLGINLKTNDQTFNKLVHAYEPKIGGAALIRYMEQITRHQPVHA